LEIYDFYGQTETGNKIPHTQPQQKYSLTHSFEKIVAIVGNMRCMPIKMGAMGLPLPGTTVEIIDDDGKPVPDMQEGHIAVKGELLFCFVCSVALNHDVPSSVNPEWPVGLFVDYWKNEEKTKEVFQHGYYYTLDKAYR